MPFSCTFYWLFLVVAEVGDETIMVLYCNKSTDRLAGLPARESELDQQKTACKDRVSRHKEETVILILDIYLDFILGISSKKDIVLKWVTSESGEF